MSKRKDRRRAVELFDSLVRQSQAGDEEDGNAGHDDQPVSDAVLAASPALSALVAPPGARRELPMMKKFRFQLLHQWVVDHHAPCRVADVGGGKGLLAYLLQRSGFASTVIDPHEQTLPAKYKDLAADRQVKVGEAERVPRRAAPFAPEMARDFDLLIALHAHGCNIQLLDAAAANGAEVVLLPCCVIGEPLVPPPGVHWLQCVAEEAARRGFLVEPFRLNFKGQNIGLYARRPE